MESEEFIALRKRLQKTQAQIAQLLGVSLKAIHSYEQGWRIIPAHAERQLFFFVDRIRRRNKPQNSCWTVKGCPEDRKSKCPAWEFQAGDLCWFINGTVCEGFAHKKWKDKIRVCRTCDVFQAALDL
jgi:hypothetical protein